MVQKLSKIAGVTRGYAQVEPNLLSAQRTGQIYAQLPVAADYFTEDRQALENGVFVKYDYANNVVNTTGKGEWMLVFNEIKLYRDGQDDCEFAMLPGNYKARVYSPSTGDLNDGGRSRDYRDVVAPADPYSLDATIDPFHIYDQNQVAYMPETSSSVVPRVLKTNIGDIFTTNAVAAAITKEAYEGKTLVPNTDGILAVKEPADGEMAWQVVKVYTMPDGQPGVKVMRIK